MLPMASQNWSMVLAAFLRNRAFCIEAAATWIGLARTCVGPKREKAAVFRGFSMLSSRRKTGAGEAIRTLDPNLGKVVLYP